MEKEEEEQEMGEKRKEEWRGEINRSKRSVATEKGEEININKASKQFWFFISNNTLLTESTVITGKCQIEVLTEYGPSPQGEVRI